MENGMTTMQFILSSYSHASRVSPIMPKATRTSTTNQGLVQSGSVMASKSVASLGVPASMGRIDLVRANIDNIIILSGAGAKCPRKNRHRKHSGDNCYQYSDLIEDSVDFDTDNLLQAPSEDIACVHGVGK